MEDKTIVTLSVIAAITIFGVVVLILGIDGGVLAAIIGILGGLAGAAGGITAYSALEHKRGNTNAFDIETFRFLKDAYARAKRQFRPLYERLASNTTYSRSSKVKPVVMDTNPDREPLVWE